MWAEMIRNWCRSTAMGHMPFRRGVKCFLNLMDACPQPDGGGSAIDLDEVYLTVNVSGIYPERPYETFFRMDPLVLRMKRN